MTRARWLAVITCLLIVGKIFAIAWLGYGDSEALYASYAVVLQPTYLDHPGGIAVIARGLGWISGTTPVSPQVAHVFTTIVASWVPYLGVLAARAAGATNERAWLSGVALVAAPETAVGLLGLTPDLPLSVTWLSTIGLVCTALKREEFVDASMNSNAPEQLRSRTPTWLLWTMAGLTAGLACWSKASGILLVLTLVVVAIRGALRTKNRLDFPAIPTPPSVTRGAVLALLIAVVIASPMIVYEATNHWPMLTHRLVSTQSRAGFSLRNVGALFGGQLAYVSPLLAIAASMCAYRLVRGVTGATTTVGRFLRDLTLVSASGLGLLCLWSRVAEPHWFAPVWLGVAVWISTVEIETILPRWLRFPSIVTGLSLSLLVHVYVLTDLFPALFGGTRLYQGRYDLASDMRMWRVVAPRLIETYSHLDAPVVLTTHWTLTAQIQVILGPNAGVTPAPSPPQPVSDFRIWMSRHVGPWAPNNPSLPRLIGSSHPSDIMVVWDDRFPRPDTASMCESHEEIPLVRGGYVVRRVWIDSDCR